MNTTISISKELKNKIKLLGHAGDTYEDVIQRLYDTASKQLLTSYLYDTSDSISIDSAIKKAKDKWQK